MSSPVKVAVLQMTSTPVLEDNLAQAEGLVDFAAREGAKLAVLPECFAYLGPEQGQLDVAEALPTGGPVLERCRGWARSHRMELVLGGFWEKTEGEGDKVRNACVHLSAEGDVVSVYRKIHLFDVDLADGTTLRESDKVEPGGDTVVTPSACGPLGLSVCYDLRFPELYRRLVDGGARAIAVPAAFTLHTGKDHWHVLLRARAIESQAYVLAAAQFGHHFGKRVSYGHALIADPWGTVLAECPDGVGVATAYVDEGTLSRVRRSLPSLAHRRL